MQKLINVLKSNSDFIISLFMIFIASVIPDLLFKQDNVWLKIGLIVIIGNYHRSLSKNNFTLNLSIILSSILLINKISFEIQSLPQYQALFNPSYFVSNVGGNISLKVNLSIPLVLIMLYLNKSLKVSFLVVGDLKTKAKGIKWLGIDNERIEWGKLAIISGILITLGTILFTVISVTGLNKAIDLNKLWANIGFILLFALANSLMEGIMYRNAVLSTLSKYLNNEQSAFLAGTLFGVAHYYGVPGGIIGMVVSSFLGWYMCRSMLETKGFASSWIIHVMQDTVVFSTLVLLGNLIV